MADQQEINPIDDLFRQTFDHLPDNPSPGGWDAPSAQVWSNLQASLPNPVAPRRNYGSWTVVGTVCIAGALSLLYWFSRDAVEVTPVAVPQPAVQSVETPAPPVVAPQMPAAKQPSAAASRRSRVATAENQPETAPAPQPVPAVPNFHNHAEKEAAHPASDGHSRALPGASTAPPNTTERRKRLGPLHAPLTPLPLRKGL